MNDLQLNILDYERMEALQARFINAITSNNIQEVKCCLHEGADVNTTTFAYQTAIFKALDKKKIYRPLSQAVHFASTQMVLLLLEQEADIHVDDGILLSIAMNNNRFNMVKLLIEEGFDLITYKERLFYDCLACRTIQSLSIVSSYIDFKEYIHEEFFKTTFYNSLNDSFKEALQHLFSSYKLHQSLSDSLIIRKDGSLNHNKL